MRLQRCTCCECTKPIKEFAWRKDSVNLIRKRTCRKCVNTQAKHRYAPEVRKNLHLRSKFGIDLKKYKEMLLVQEGLCAICKRPETMPGRNRKIRDLAVDHCHLTGKVRGLLCGLCNTAIGALDESESRLLSCIEYLRSNK